MIKIKLINSCLVTTANFKRTEDIFGNYVVALKEKLSEKLEVVAHDYIQIRKKLNMLT